MLDLADTCLEQRGNKFENDYHLVLERLADKAHAVIDRFDPLGEA